MDASRYQRQMLLPEIGPSGQKQLAASSVFVVGCGGLGSTLLYDLCGMGVGRIGFCDGDDVTLSNLNRQFLHDVSDIGKNKALSAYARLKGFAPELTLEAFDQHLTNETAGELLPKYDLILLAVDSIQTRLDVNHACVLAKKPLVDAGVYGMNGTVYTYRPRKTACLACYYANIAQQQTSPVPGVAPVVSAISSLEAISALNILLDLPNPTDGRLLLFDGKTMTTEFVSIAANKQCPICSI